MGGLPRLGGLPENPYGVQQKVEVWGQSSPILTGGPAGPGRPSLPRAPWGETAVMGGGHSTPIPPHTQPCAIGPLSHSRRRRRGRDVLALRAAHGVPAGVEGAQCWVGLSAEVMGSVLIFCASVSPMPTPRTHHGAGGAVLTRRTRFTLYGKKGRERMSPRLGYTSPRHGGGRPPLTLAPGAPASPLAPSKPG